MIRHLSIILSLGLGACVSTSASGTRPADMDAQAHVQACRSHLGTPATSLRHYPASRAVQGNSYGLWA